MTEEQRDNNNNKTKCETFNGDTPTGRTKWQQWLRDIQLVLDDWSWAVMNNDVLDHEKFNKYLKLKEEEKLTDTQSKKMQYMYDKAAKSTAATKGKKSVQEWKKEMQTDHEAFRTLSYRRQNGIPKLPAETTHLPATCVLRISYCNELQRHCSVAGKVK